MKSTRKGLRDGELYRDTYERLNCERCGQTLKKRSEDEEVYAVRICPDCNRRWKELP